MVLFLGTGSMPLLQGMNKTTLMQENEIQRKRLVFDAVSRNDFEQFKKMVRDPNEQDDKKRTLLLLAVRYSRVEMVKFLLAPTWKYKVDVNCADGEGACPLTVAVRQVLDKEGDMSLEIVKMLVGHGADINGGNGPLASPLEIACTGTNFALVNYLVRSGANINGKVSWDGCIQGFSPIHMACTYRNFAIIKYLVEHGANINMQSKRGLTCLHLLYLPKDGDNIAHTYDIMQYLIKKGANPEIKDRAGLLPVQYASKQILSKLLDFKQEQKKEKPLNYVIALNRGLDAPGFGSELLAAYRGWMGAITEDIVDAITSQQIIVLSTSLLHGLLLFADDPLTEERVKWWLKNGKTQEFRTFDEARNNLQKEILQSQKKLNLCRQMARNSQEKMKSGNNDLTRTFNVRQCEKYDAVARVHDPETIKNQVLTTLENAYNAYLSEKGNYVVLIPRRLGFAQLPLCRLAGFRDEVLKLVYSDTISFDSFQKTIARYEKVCIDASELANLFDPTNKRRKNIVLTGHGNQSVFAGLDANGTHEVLNKINEINGASVLFSTCCLGGKVILDLFKTTKTFDLRKMKYPIIASATSENSINSTIFFEKYFSYMDLYITKNSRGDLIQALKTLHSLDPSKETPSMYEPRGVGAFEPVVVEEKKVINLSYFTEEQLSRESELIVEDGKCLLYNIARIGIPLKIGKSSQLVSVAKGAFIHLFTEITAKDMSLVQCISTLVSTMTSSKRLYFVQKLTCNDGEIKGLAIFVTPKKVEVRWRNDANMPEKYHLYSVEHRVEVGMGFTSNDIATAKSTRLEHTNGQAYEDGVKGWISDLEKGSNIEQVLKDASLGRDKLPALLENIRSIVSLTGTGKRPVVDYGDLLLGLL